MDMAVRTFTAIIHEEDGLYVAERPEVGTVSQGETVEEAVLNLKEATELYLEEFPLPDAGRPSVWEYDIEGENPGRAARNLWTDGPRGRRKSG